MISNTPIEYVVSDFKSLIVSIVLLKLNNFPSELVYACSSEA